MLSCLDSSTLPILLSLSEALGKSLIQSKTPETYISLVLKGMRDEWILVKSLLANLIVSSASSTDIPLTEAIEFESTVPLKNSIRNIMIGYSQFTGDLINTALKKAKSDTVPTLTQKLGGVTTIALSKESFQKVIASLKFQKDFVDDLSKSVVERVERISAQRYANKMDLRKNVNRLFRIDRDKSLNLFHNAVDKHAQGLINNTLTSEEFKKKMMDSIDVHYKKLYKEGKKITTLEPWENEFLKRQVSSQEQYLNNFTKYIEQQKVLGNELTGRVSQRAHLYAERGTAMFEAGHMASLPNDVLLDWVMNPAEHCATCPLHAAGSPYTKETLPGLPGDGSSTQCMTNCKCSLLVSPLYVTKPASIPAFDLAIEVTRDDTRMTIAQLPKSKALPVGSAKRLEVPADLAKAKRQGKKFIRRGN